MRLGLPGGISSGGERLDRAADPRGGGAQRLRIGERREVSFEACVPRAQPLRVLDAATELGDRARGGAHLAGREQRFAPVERELGARLIVGLERVDRATEETGCERQVVARQRSPSGRAEVPCRAPSELETARVERTELA